MSNFNSIISHIFKVEGGYANQKHDKGKATNYGISLRFLELAQEDIDGDGHINEKDIKALTKDNALDLYKEYFWDHYGLENIRDVLIAKKAMDMFVNMRGKVAARAIQSACVECGAKIKVDGILGKNSFSAINDLSKFTGSRDILLEAIRDAQRAVYIRIVENDKTQKKFLKGWMRRASL